MAASARNKDSKEAVPLLPLNLIEDPETENIALVDLDACLLSPCDRDDFLSSTLLSVLTSGRYKKVYFWTHRTLNHILVGANMMVLRGFNCSRNVSELAEKIKTREHYGALASSFSLASYLNEELSKAGVEFCEVCTPDDLTETAPKDNPCGSAFRNFIMDYEMKEYCKEQYRTKAHETFHKKMTEGPKKADHQGMELTEFDEKYQHNKNLQTVLCIRDAITRNEKAGTRKNLHVDVFDDKVKYCSAISRIVKMDLPVKVTVAAYQHISQVLADKTEREEYHFKGFDKQASMASVVVSEGQLSTPAPAAATNEQKSKKPDGKKESETAQLLPTNWKASITQAEFKGVIDDYQSNSYWSYCGCFFRSSRAMRELRALAGNAVITRGQVQTALKKDSTHRLNLFNNEKDVTVNGSGTDDVIEGLTTAFRQ